MNQFIPWAAHNNTMAPPENTTAGQTGSDSVNLAETMLSLLGLQAVAPLYAVLGKSLGIDPTYLLISAGLAWAANKLFSRLYKGCWSIVYTYFMSSVHISSSDEIYYHLMKWLSLHPPLLQSRSLMAQTERTTAWEDEDESNIARDPSGLYLNFSNQEARSPPKYIPAVGYHSFWWRGQYFKLQRKQESIFDDEFGGLSAYKDKEILIISCLWRSPDPIKKLLKYVKEEYHKDHQARTTIKRPSAQNVRRRGGIWAWQRVVQRPVREMRTVVLDPHQKLAVLSDINEYLHPRTPRWYANRGIPLRRGYLFHGPPGTGKTSLSFAIAGVFGLDIYVISLQEPTLTEEDLSDLFSSLPRRCIVLLEDIDNAGLRRPENELEKEEASKGQKALPHGTEEKEKDPASKPDKEDANDTEGPTKGRKGRNNADSAPNNWKVSDLAKALKENKSDEKKGISLSGLLNAIDGVASHEGRILIMTTNVPEALDAALIRPGRVDLQVGFTNATKQQAQELFIRMYEADQDGPPSPTEGGGAALMQHPALATTQSSGVAKAASTEKHGDHQNGSAAVSNTTSNNINTLLPTPGGGRDENGNLGKTASDYPLLSGASLDIGREALPDIARQFADKIPDGEFSPAEIQGYLLKRKKHPRVALEEADKWVEALVRQKASNSKILQMQ